MQADKILVFPFDLMSHYTRCLVLVEKFYPDTAQEILFQSSLRYNALVEQRGFKTFDTERFDADYVMACAARFDFSWLNEQDIERVFLSQVKAIESHQPTLAIGDTSPTLKMAAEKTGVRYIALTNGYMTKHYAHTRKLSRTHVAFKHVSLLPERLGDFITNVAEKAVFTSVHAPFRRLRRKYGLKKITSYLDELEGDDNLICDTPALFPQKNLPTNFRFIGPLIYERNDLPAPTRDPSKPNILVCMGSTGDWSALKFLNDDAFAKYHIVTASDKLKVLNAAHVDSYDFVNMSKAAANADLMICHGGNGTIYHGLLNGVYMLCLTNNFEQEWNVHALERLGYGKSINDCNGNWKQVIADALKIPIRPIAARAI